jgi:hypothetical protein
MTMRWRFRMTSHRSRPTCQLAENVAIETILAALVATRDGPGGAPATC